MSNVQGWGRFYWHREQDSNTVHRHINSKLARIVIYSINNAYVVPGHRFPLDRTDVKKRWKRDDFTVKTTQIFRPLAPILVACTRFWVFCWHTLSPKSLLRADVAVCRWWRKCDVTMRLSSNAMSVRVCSHLGRSEVLPIYNKSTATGT
jgi:hypothetical protein